jgi:peptidoglycan L-alanyl-D-glutamate endopeptidase CwlK
MTYKFGKRSEQQLATCHADLQMIMRVALASSTVDFGVVEGHRSLAVQQQYFKAGKSKIDGITQQSKHNKKPSEAVDIVISVPGKPALGYEIKHLCYVAGVITATAKMLYAQGKVKHLIRWGGNWDSDSEIISDQTFQDLVHFELVIL